MIAWIGNAYMHNGQKVTCQDTDFLNGRALVGSVIAYEHGTARVEIVPETAWVGWEDLSPVPEGVNIPDPVVVLA